jgi:ABC-type uncharacterized transport system substrate-binding protein
MFIDTSVTFAFEDDTLTGFWVEWKFDEIFSGTIGLDYDRNRDGSLNEREQELIRKNAFSNLRNYHYFITVRHAGTEWKADTVKRFSARMENDRLYYRFFVPYRVEVNGTPSNVRVVIFDHTFYSDIAYVDSRPLSFEGADQLEIHADIIQNKDNPVFYDPVGGRQRSSAENRVKRGKAYPYEIHLSMRPQ